MVVAFEREAALAPLTAPGPYRITDYFALPDEPRCELIDGRLLMTPAPIFRHQEIVLELAAQLRVHAQQHGARVAASPVDVVLGERSVVQPDVVYVSAERKAIVGERVEGAPDLVIEVLSPGTARRDQGEKMKLYAEAGVGEYWLVDPAAKSIQFLRHRDGHYEVRLALDGAFASEAVPGFVLELEPFWRAIPD